MLRRTTTSLVAVSLLLSACSSDPGDGTPAAPGDPSEATSCAELADLYVDATQRMLDAIGARTSEELALLDETGQIPDDLQDASDEVMSWLLSPGYSRVGELCTDGAEWERLVCDRRTALTSRGPEGDRHLRDNFPPCD